MHLIAWGKLRTDENGIEIARLPLTHHCADVAAVAEALLSKGAISRRLARLAGLVRSLRNSSEFSCASPFSTISVSAIGDFEPKQSQRLTASVKESELRAMCVKSRRS